MSMIGGRTSSNNLLRKAHFGLLAWVVVLLSLAAVSPALAMGEAGASLAVSVDPAVGFAPQETEKPAVETAPAEPGITVEEDRAADRAEPQPGERRINVPVTSIVVDTGPPKLDSASFGVGWPAAIAVAVALAAVLAMALTWNRAERA